MKAKEFVRFTFGTLGFLSIIKGISGVIQQATIRPSSSWRTSLTIRDLLICVYICFCVPRIISFFQHNQSNRWMKLLAMAILFLFIWAFPIQIRIFSLHPMIFFLTGCLFVPALHLSSQKNTE